MWEQIFDKSCRLFRSRSLTSALCVLQVGQILLTPMYVCLIFETILHSMFGLYCTCEKNFRHNPINACFVFYIYFYIVIAFNWNRLLNLLNCKHQSLIICFMFIFLFSLKKKSLFARTIKYISFSLKSSFELNLKFTQKLASVYCKFFIYNLLWVMWRQKT